MLQSGSVDQGSGTRRSPNRIRVALASPNIFNWSGAAMYAVPNFLTLLFFDRNRFGGTIEQWLLLGAAVYLLVLGAYAGAALGYRAFLRRRPPTVFYVIPAFSLIGLFRGVAVYALGTNMGLVPSEDLLLRVLGGPVGTSLLLCITALLGLNFTSGLAEGLVFHKRRVVLLDLQRSLSTRIERQRADLLEKVQETLRPALANLRDELARASRSESKAVLATLYDTVENVVRPLSHKIADSDEPAAVSEEKLKYRKWWVVPPFAMVPFRKLLAPELSALLIFMLSLPASIALKSLYEGIAIALIEAISTYVILASTRRLLVRLYLPISVAALCVIGLFAVVQLMVIAVTTSFGLVVPHLRSLDIYIFGVSFGFALAFGQAMQLARSMGIRELARVNRELELVVARLRQEVWLNNKRMASVLHGPVQTSLYAASMKLSGLKDVSPALVAEVESDIAEALKQLDPEFHQANTDFEATISQIISLWSGSCEIKLEASEEAEAALRSDENAANCAIEVIQEAIGNAIKHGKARRASIQVSLAAEGLVEVRVANEGLGLAGSADNPVTETSGRDRQHPAGYGSHILNDVCHSWSLEDDQNGVLLTANIALAR